jgi:16S rRNA (uracil1498-N3)-methyltransferase
MKQFILKEKPDGDGFVRFLGDDYHYLVRVKRLKPGAVFKALLPADGKEPEAEYTVTVRSIDDTVLSAVVSSGLLPDAGNSVPLVLFQALPKGTKMDIIVRQAAEGAVRRVVPFVSEHSVPRGKSAAAEERWRRIVKEARQQSGSAVDTRVEPVLGMDELFAYWEKLRSVHDNALALLLHEAPLSSLALAGPLEQGTFHRYLYTDPALVVLAAGPEGGFSAAELGRFLDAGFKPLHIAGTVLRSETAALYGTAAVRIILLERASWMLRQ